jgi:hypothetical protein
MSGRPHFEVLIAGLVVIGAASSCTRLQWGVPHVAVRAVSPDQRYTAVVRNRPNIDPPAQSLWLEQAGTSAIQLQELLGDVDWCDAIAWSGDSSTVAFLVRGAKLVIADTATKRITDERWLVPQTGAYPPLQVVRALTLSSDGRGASFQICDRIDDARKSRSNDVWDDTVAYCSPSHLADLRAPRTNGGRTGSLTSLRTPR